jgi:hypothetical protein
MKPGDRMQWNRVPPYESRPVRLVEPEWPGWWVVRGEDGRDYYAERLELQPLPDNSP